MTPERRLQLKEAYLYVFDVFATGVSGVATHLGVSKESARKMLRTLRDDFGLLGDVDVNDEAQGAWRRGAYKEMCWQSSPSYDDISHAEAVALFDERVPEAEYSPKAQKQVDSAYACAQIIAKQIRKDYGIDFLSGEVDVWSAKKMSEWSECTKAPTIVWEGGDYEWAIGGADMYWDIANSHGYYLEPYNGFMLSVYKTGG